MFVGELVIVVIKVFLGWGKKKIKDEVKKEMDNKHKHFSKKQNETGFDPNGKFGYLVLILSFF